MMIRNTSTVVQDQQEEIDKEEAHRISVKPERCSSVKDIQSPTAPSRSPRSQLSDVTNDTPNDTSSVTHCLGTSDSQVGHKSETGNSDKAEQDILLAFFEISVSDTYFEGYNSTLQLLLPQPLPVNQRP